jgi:hypothetical protein
MTNSDAGAGIMRETRDAMAREYAWPGRLPEPVTPAGEHDPAGAGEYELRDLRAVIEATTGRPVVPADRAAGDADDPDAGWARSTRRSPSTTTA